MFSLPFALNSIFASTNCGTKSFLPKHYLSKLFTIMEQQTVYQTEGKNINILLFKVAANLKGFT